MQQIAGVSDCRKTHKGIEQDGGIGMTLDIAGLVSFTGEIVRRTARIEKWG
jgi:hypothetical protein